MADETDFDDFLGRIEPMTPQEQQEMILGYLAVLLDGMGPESVATLRAHLVKRFPASKEQDTITEVIDGHLALRRLKISAGDTPP